MIHKALQAWRLFRSGDQKEHRKFHELDRLFVFEKLSDVVDHGAENIHFDKSGQNSGIHKFSQRSVRLICQVTYPALIFKCRML